MYEGKEITFVKRRGASDLLNMPRQVYTQKPPSAFIFTLADVEGGSGKPMEITLSALAQ